MSPEMVRIATNICFQRNPGTKIVIDHLGAILIGSAIDLSEGVSEATGKMLSCHFARTVAGGEAKALPKNRTNRDRLSAAAVTTRSDASS